MRHNCLRFPDKYIYIYISVRDVEDAVPYKSWKEHYEFVECGKVQVRRGRVTTPYRMGETKVNTKIPSPSPGGREAGRPTACLHTNISPKPKARYKPKKLVPDFYLILLVLYD